MVQKVTGQKVAGLSTRTRLLACQIQAHQRCPIQWLLARALATLRVLLKLARQGTLSFFSRGYANVFGSSIAQLVHSFVQFA